jgi:hypothetical protein
MLIVDVDHVRGGRAYGHSPQELPVSAALKIRKFEVFDGS